MSYVSEPSATSILKKSIASAFSLYFTPQEFSGEGELLTIHDLNLSNEELTKLKSIKVFPEDHWETVYSMSIHYLLLSNISEQTLTILKNQISRLFSMGKQLPNEKELIEIDECPIFSEKELADIKDYYITDFTFYKNLMSHIRIDGIIKWDDIKLFTEQYLIKKLGFTMNAFYSISLLWQMKENAFNLKTELSYGLPLSGYSKLDEFINTFINFLVKNQRDQKIMKLWTGLYDGEKWKLKQIGLLEKISTQRVRQITCKYYRKLYSNHSLRMLNHFWKLVNDFLITRGGVSTAKDISVYLANRLNWNSAPSDKRIACLIQLSHEYEIIHVNSILIIKRNHPCVRCNSIISNICRITENEKDGKISVCNVLNQVKNDCYKNCGDHIHLFNNFDVCYMEFLKYKSDKLLIEDGMLYSGKEWLLNYGRISEIINTVLLDAGHALHFNEVLRLVRHKRPELNLTGRTVHARLTTMPSVVLWDRGTFIHQQLIQYASNLIEKIERQILTLLSKKIPYISVSGLFNKNKEILLHNKIPSPSALYSCLRLHQHDLITYPNYPIIILKEKEWLPLVIILSDYIENKNRIVTKKEIRRFYEKKLLMNPKLFDSYLTQIPEVIRVANGQYLHLRHVYIELSKLDAITTDLDNMLLLNDHVSVREFFNEYKGTCMLSGIKTPVFLYSLLSIYYSDKYVMNRFPTIYKCDPNKNVP